MCACEEPAQVLVRNGVRAIRPAGPQKTEVYAYFGGWGELAAGAGVMIYAAGCAGKN